MDASALAKACGLAHIPHGRGALLLSPERGCGCDLVENANDIHASEWRLEPETSAALHRLVDDLAAKGRMLRVTSSYFGEGIATELSMKFDAFHELLDRRRLGNRTAYVLRVRTGSGRRTRV